VFGCSYFQYWVLLAAVETEMLLRVAVSVKFGLIKHAAYVASLLTFCAYDTTPSALVSTVFRLFPDTETTIPICPYTDNV